MCSNEAMSVFVCKDKNYFDFEASCDKFSAITVILIPLLSIQKTHNPPPLTTRTPIPYIITADSTREDAPRKKILKR